MPDAPLLDIRHLRIEATVYPPGEPAHDIVIVDDVSLTLEKGRVLGLIGESGAGKSTIGLSPMGYGRGGVRITGGEVFVNGRDILKGGKRGLRRLRGKEVCYVAQSAAAAFNPAHKLMDQVVEVLAQAWGGEPGRGGAPRQGALREARPPGPGQFRQPLSPPGLRRPAPARHDRDGALPRAGPDHLRRADDGPRRDDPDRRARRDQGRHPRHRRRRPLHHPRSRRRRPGLRRDHGAAPRQARRTRQRPPDHRCAAAGIHPGARLGPLDRARGEDALRDADPFGDRTSRPPTVTAPPPFPC